MDVTMAVPNEERPERNPAAGIAADTGPAPKAVCAYERKARANGTANTISKP
ncbi:hypothetical protein [Mucilaginibacter sp.]|uniref:hypothetical protein n=1 Tax=Mucilaginibacter sp. TaxID=1882438 RepID=UPI003266C82D